MDCAKPQYTNELTQLIMGFHKSTLVARGANMQLDPNCVVAYQRLLRLTWICLHTLLNACLNHHQLLFTVQARSQR